ncbi:hypothetical protein IJ384_07225 [bacterium]|nr:hypothetical protein [bacterium]
MFFFSEIKKEKILPGSVEHAYLTILEGDFISAKRIFETLDSPRARWGISLTNILLGYIENFPTYFEIRNFLEIDLDFLIKNEKIDFVEQVLGSLELLANINQETYKYVARVMFENRLYKSAREYLEKSKDIFYNDPELHFLFAKYYIKTREYEKADFYLDECLSILPDYYPAKILQKEISRYLA